MRFPHQIATVCLLLAGAGPAFAHRLIVDPTPVGDRLRVEAYYEDDTPAQYAKVTVVVDGRTVAEGQTDDRGVWTCPRPAPGTYTVRVADHGHAGKETVVIPDPNASPLAVSADPDPPREDRSERTRTPWGRLAIGLAIIAGLTLVWRFRPRPARAVSPRTQAGGAA